ncbi:CYTH domain-containing protein [Lysinibacillus sphaericus]
MAQEIEIEFKNLLTKEEYMKMIQQFSVKDTDFMVQENHYFDTPGFQLKERQSALRVRQKEGTYTLTLKTPVTDGLLETNQRLSAVQAEELLDHGIFPDGEVKDFLLNLGASVSSLCCFGSLRTKRAELAYRGGLLVFDESSYFDKVDYELEYEVKDFKEGEKIFFNFLKEIGIPIRETENKIKRFYREKVRRES